MNKQEVQESIDKKSLELSCSPSDWDFIKGYMNFGYSLASKELEEAMAEIEALKNIRNVVQRNLRDEMDNHQKIAEECERLEKEIAELKEWKQSAISVMPPIQEIGKALGIKLGESIYDKILPGIERLKGLIETAFYSDYLGQTSFQQFKEQNNFNQ